MYMHKYLNASWYLNNFVLHTILMNKHKYLNALIPQQQE